MEQNKFVQALTFGIIIGSAIEEEEHEEEDQEGGFIEKWESVENSFDDREDSW